MTDPQRNDSRSADNALPTDAADTPERPRRLTMARPVVTEEWATRGTPAGHPPVSAAPYAHSVPFARALPLSPIDVSMRWWMALLQIMTLAFFLVGGFLAGMFAGLFLGHAEDAWLNMISSAGMGLGGLAYVFMQLNLSNASARTIGWTFRDWSQNAAIGIAALITFYCVAFAIAFTIMILIAQHNPEILEAEPESARAIKETFPEMSLPVVVLLMTFVAVWEEIVFRGFLLTRLRAMVKRWWLAVFLGAILFSFGHIYQGLLGMFLTFVLGLVLGALFVWRKSLVPGITYHIVQNVLAYQMTQWLYAGV